MLEIPNAIVPSNIYHYCTVESLMAILKSKKLWLSHSHSLNDSTEARWGVDMTLLHLKTELEKQNLSLDILENPTLQFQLQQCHHYLASFSAIRDNLSQWRAYTDDGKGVCISFVPQEFGLKIGIPSTSVVPENTIGIIDVVYDISEQVTIIDMAVDDFKKPYPGGMPEEKLLDLSFLLSHFAIVLKNPFFKEEQEWRIVYKPLLNFNLEKKDQVIGKLNELKFRTRNGNIIPYFEFPFLPHAINEIVLGPKCTLSAYNLNLLLVANDFYNCRISRSDAPYC